MLIHIICYLYDEIPQRDNTVYIQTKYIHASPVIRYRKKKYITESEFLFVLKQNLTSNCLVAYKGGDKERYVLNTVNIKSVNLEVFDCMKYDDLLLRYNLKLRCCREHLRGYSGHCSRYEVIVFAFFIFDELDQYSINKDKYVNFYNRV